MPLEPVAVGLLGGAGGIDPGIIGGACWGTAIAGVELDAVVGTVLLLAVE